MTFMLKTFWRTVIFGYDVGLYDLPQNSREIFERMTLIGEE